MISQKIKKLKKYLFFISIMFFVLTLSHLAYSYLYSDSKNSPVKWWTISEWIIGNFPSLNPLVSLNSDSNNKYIIELLYRSILKYDIDQKKIVWDIANCDISSLINIECIIKDDAKWSNGENIKAEDIIATYQLIKETWANKVLVSLLEWTEIESKDNNVVIFKNQRKDVNFLNVFLQPILNKSFIDTLSQENITKNFPVKNWIYSGKFVVEKVIEDEKLGITKLNLVKNEFYDKSNISKIIINIFPDIQSFKNKHQAVNIFNDTENNIWNSISRFQDYKYNLNSFVWIFLNQEKIKNTDLRNYILNKIDSNKLVKVLSDKNYSVVENPFLTKESIYKEPNNKNFDSVMASIWYKKKSAYTQEITPIIEKPTTNSWTVEKPAIPTPAPEKPAEITIPADLTIDKYQSKSKLIVSPDYVDRYNFITKDDVLLKWKNPTNVEAVYVNDYKLANFKPGWTDFYYRLKESVWNLKAWRNDYKIFFEIGGKKELQEELAFIYYHDKEKLKAEEKALAESLYRKEVEEKNKANPAQVVPTPAPTPKVEEKKVEPKVVNQEQLDKVNKLDENLYYSKDFKEFTLTLYYLNDGKKEIEDTVKFIEKSLRELWIVVKSVPFSLKELPRILVHKDWYDMILTWVHLGYFNFNLFPYLHSSQAKSWNNFTNIRKPSLDLLVEELKENISSVEKTAETEKKVLEILKNEQVLKTLYTPKVNLLVDKNIKIEKTYDSLPYRSERSWILEHLYIKEDVKIDWKDKSFSWFFMFLLKKLYE